MELTIDHPYRFFDCSNHSQYHLLLLCNAILSVDHKYLWYDRDVSELTFDEDHKKQKEHLERVFAYELYHQWSLLLTACETNLTLNAEINKKVFDIQKENKTTVFPDFVLHSCQENKDKQIIACEVKRKLGTKYVQIEEDINALISYIDNSLFGDCPFEFGVFVFVGTNRTFLVDEIKKCNKTNWIQYSNRIICITYNYLFEKNQYSFSLDYLSTIINNQNS